MRLRFLLAAAAICWVVESSAQSTPRDWGRTAELDLDAAFALVQTNHPAAHPSVGDTTFVAALEQSFRLARERLPSVATEAGYRAVLRGFATGLGDAHLSVQFASPIPVRWPGFVVRRTAGEFRVARVDPSVAGVRVGDQIVSCDGEPVEALAKRRLGGFRAQWWIEADIVRTAFYLFVDDGNPFAPVPAGCTIRDDVGERGLTLDWRPIDGTALGSLVQPSLLFLGQPTFAAELRGDLYWVAMPEMTAAADSIIAVLQGDQAKLDQARAVVIDLRTNGGGDSRKGEEVVRALFGEPLLRRASRLTELWTGQSHFRATPFVLQSLEGFAKSRGEQYGAGSAEAKSWAKEAAQVRRAIAAGQAFWPALRSAPSGREKPERRLRPSGRVARTVVLTDGFCFSSCLLFVQVLRAAGVRQIGAATNASTRYMEVRHAKLPSGLAEFSTLQKVSFAAPHWLGPYLPDQPFPPSFAGAAAVEAWVTAVAGAR